MCYISVLVVLKANFLGVTTLKTMQCTMDAMNTITK
jgi:hypothetical protein